MAFLKIIIKLLSPVILSSYVSDNNLTGTLDHIPASSISGLFVARYIFKEKIKEAHKDDIFFSWFLRNNIVFTNAYISEKEDYSEIDMLPTPLCVKKIKNDDLIINILIDDIDEQTVSTSSFSYINGNHIKTTEPQKVINFHHKRDRLKGHTTDEGMFNYEALVPGQVFKGEIHGDEKTLKKFKEVFGEKIYARLGKSRGAEYGKVEISILDINDEDLEGSILNFEDEDFTLLTFVSPCILLNENGFPDPSVSNLKRYLQSIWGKDSFEIENCVMKDTIVENYISVWKMKTPLERAIYMGSTVKLTFSEDLSFEDIKKGLLLITENGIGERKGEGFGRVRVNMAMNEKYSQRVIEAKIKKPNIPVPQEAKKIFVSVIQNMFKQEFEYKAYNDARGFSSLPSNSLLGKLGLMLFDTKGSYELKDIIEKLRDKAKEQLKNCKKKSSNISLYAYIIEFEPLKISKSIYSDSSKQHYDKLAQLAEYNIENDADFLIELWYLYFDVLFKSMRQRQQSEQVSGKEA